jgi:hypothetical protein
MRRRALLGGLLLCLAMFTAAELHEWSGGRDAMQESDRALSLGNVRDATVAARRAAEAAVLGSPYSGQGYARLEVLARAAETEGRVDDAAFAWRAMRSAAVATRPAKESQRRVDEAVSGILHLAPDASPADRSAANLGLGLTTPRQIRARAVDAPGAPIALLRRELASGEPPSPWLPSALGWGALALLVALAHRLGGVTKQEPRPLST